MLDSKLENRLLQFRELFTNYHLLLEKSGSDLLSLSSKFSKLEEKYIAAYPGGLIRKRIAVVGSHTTHYWLMVFKLFLFSNGIAPVFYEAEYDSVNSEILNDASGLYSFKPEILILLTHHKDIADFPALFSGETEIEDWIDLHKNHYLDLWQRTQAIEGCQIIHCLFALPYYRQSGILENNYLFSRDTCLKKLNISLIESNPRYLTIVDMDYFASVLGKIKWFDDVSYYLSKQGFSIEAFAMTANAVSKLVADYCGKSKKCLVLDLDNTLWGGVIGDDGMENINIDPNNAVGEAYRAFQKYVRDLKNRGVILAVCSKNEEETAKKPFISHSGMILKLDDIACFTANWNDKAGNIAGIAETLNIGLDSLVFFDDNPAERELVRKFLPQVQVIEVPEDPAEYIQALELSGAFEKTQLSREDLTRSDSYTANVKREQLQQQFVDYDAYLKSLEMSAVLAKPGNAELARFTQLINKSNQFNLRTVRYTDAAIQSMNEAEGHVLLYVSLSDKFTHYGIIASVVLKKIENFLFIDTLVMSCRVLKRGVELAIFNKMLDIAEKMGCSAIIGEYIPTVKNRMVEKLLPELGFAAESQNRYADSISKSSEDSVLYALDCSSAKRKEHFIHWSDVHAG